MNIHLLILAIIAVESNNNHNAVGDSGKAFGPMQVHKGVIEDINTIYKTKYSHRDAFDLNTSKLLFNLYTTYWSEYYHTQTKKPVTLETLARIWNGGPFFYLKPHKTDAYWTKVKLELNKLSNNETEK